MLSDLRQYITHKCEIEKDTIAWYLKKILESCKDEKLVHDVLDDLKDSYGELCGYEINPFEQLLLDYHMLDYIYTSEQMVVLDILLKCFIQDYDYEMYDAEYFFRHHTARGGSNDCLADMIENQWIDFYNIFYEEPEIKGVYEIDEEVSYILLTIVVDEQDSCYTEIAELLELLCFNEVEPGLFFYGAYTWSGYMDHDITLEEDELEKIIEMLPQEKRNLDDYNSILNVFNTYSPTINNLISSISNSYITENEVLF